MGKNKFTEEELEDFIRENKDKFDVYQPKENHSNKFLVKLQDRLHKIFVSIVPHLVKVAITTVIVFAVSLFVWNGWIRSDRDQMSLGSVSSEYRKMERNYKSEIKAKDKLLKNYFESNPLLKKTFYYNIDNLDSTYISLKKELKKHSDSKIIIEAMKYYYVIKINAYNVIINLK